MGGVLYFLSQRNAKVMHYWKFLGSVPEYIVPEGQVAVEVEDGKEIDMGEYPIAFQMRAVKNIYNCKL